MKEDNKPWAIETMTKEQPLGKMKPEVLVTGRETGRAALMASDAIEFTKTNMIMAQRLVTEMLEPEIDFGHIPGVRGQGLWDPGASKIMNAFECYARHNVIFHEETEDTITWVIQVEGVSRLTDKVIGTGVGACSTKEPKYKYRWVPDPGKAGYSSEEIAGLKTKTVDNGRKTLYRILNPDYGELVNTILKMASKRAEVDLAASLPGVAGALRRIFGGSPGHSGDYRPAAGSTKKKAPADNSLNQFWQTAKSLGIENQEVHTVLGVSSLKDWAGSPSEALEIISKWATLVGYAKSGGIDRAVILTMLGHSSMTNYLGNNFTWKDAALTIKQKAAERKAAAEAKPDTDSPFD